MWVWRHAPQESFEIYLDTLNWIISRPKWQPDDTHPYAWVSTFPAHSFPPHCTSFSFPIDRLKNKYSLEDGAHEFAFLHYLQPFASFTLSHQMCQCTCFMCVELVCVLVEPWHYLAMSSSQKWENSGVERYFSFAYQVPLHILRSLSQEESTSVPAPEKYIIWI